MCRRMRELVLDEAGEGRGSLEIEMGRSERQREVDVMGRT